MISLTRELPRCAYESCGRTVKVNGAGRIKSRWCCGHQKQITRGKPLTPLRGRCENGTSMVEDSRVAMLGRRIEYLLQRMGHDGLQFPSDARMSMSGWEPRLAGLGLENEEFERQVDQLAAEIAQDPEAGRSRRRRWRARNESAPA